MESMQNGLVMAGTPDIPRTWETLFSQALKVIGEIARRGRDDPFWTFDGGTVLMLRYGHRSFGPIEPIRTPVTTAVLPKRCTFTSLARSLIAASELNSASNAAGFRT